MLKRCRDRELQTATGSSDTDGEVVYFLRAGDAIKIGYTTNLAARKRALETASAVPLELLASIPGDRSEEARLHREWWHLHIRGEWFHVDEELLRYIREQINGDISHEPAPCERAQATRVRQVLAGLDEASLAVIGIG
jgi:hypothetical protein